ncbi:hypothetical protein LC612_42005 [Nostoc sp. CHAB 5834]|nr:hypothetical protein [Nostoc sp. CHAB 5834]
MEEKKFVVIIGKNIQKLSVEKLREQRTLSHFPELGDFDSLLGFRPPLHADEIVRKLRGLVENSALSGITIVTHNSFIVSTLAELVEQGKVQSAELEIQMYEGDAPSLEDEPRRFKVTEEGYLEDGWPFGWFEPSLFL